MTDQSKTSAVTNPPKIGQYYVVGQFFWIDEDDCIGLDDDAVHGNGMDLGGSVSPGDMVRVLGFEGNAAVVKVLKKNVPYGAPCPHGMIFMMPISQIMSWPQHVARRQAEEARRADLARKYIGTDHRL